MSSGFPNTDALSKIAADLFNGWGYNFYRRENLLRSDDLMIRAKVCELLTAARVSVNAAEKAYRHEFLPAPSREKPRPDPQGVRNAQTLERLGGAIGGLEGHIRALPVPEADRMALHMRPETETLLRLLEADQAMVGHAEFFRSVLHTASAAWILENAGSLAEQVTALEGAIQARRELLGF